MDYLQKNNNTWKQGGHVLGEGLGLLERGVGIDMVRAHCIYAWNYRKINKSTLLKNKNIQKQVSGRESQVLLPGW